MGCKKEWYELMMTNKLSIKKSALNNLQKLNTLLKQHKQIADIVVIKS